MRFKTASFRARRSVSCSRRGTERASQSSVISQAFSLCCSQPEGVSCLSPERPTAERALRKGPPMLGPCRTLPLDSHHGWPGSLGWACAGPPGHPFLIQGLLLVSSHLCPRVKGVRVRAVVRESATGATQPQGPARTLLPCAGKARGWRCLGTGTQDAHTHCLRITSSHSSRRSRGHPRLGHHRSPVPSTELACRPRPVLTACPWEVSLPEARARVGPAALVLGVVSSESCLIIGVLGPPNFR